MNEPQKPHLSPEWIDPEALRIVRKLQQAGHSTYVVGGCVRDLLLGQHPKDFDISTMALPQQVKRLVPYSYIIGRRFRLVLAKRGEDQFEISTFRKQTPPSTDEEEEEPTGPIMDDNVFGSPQDDAMRRDFTVNGMFYDPESGELIDYVEGLKDIKGGLIRMIGDPFRRLEEDPIRVLRALRMAHKAQFSLEGELRRAISEKAESVQMSVLPRRREEVLKWLRLPKPSQVFLEAYDLGVLLHLLPTLSKEMDSSSKFLDLWAFHLDQIAETTFSSSPTPKELFAALLFATYLATQETRGEVPKDLSEDPVFGELMRNQLGMFKYEQHDIAKAFQLLRTFPKLHDFKKRSRSRQLSFFKSPSFPLALSLAQADYLLEPKAVHEWQQLYNSHGADVRAEERPPRPRRSPRRRRQPRQQKAAQKS